MQHRVFVLSVVSRFLVRRKIARDPDGASRIRMRVEATHRLQKIVGTVNTEAFKFKLSIVFTVSDVRGSGRMGPWCPGGCSSPGGAAAAGITHVSLIDANTDGIKTAINQLGWLFLILEEVQVWC